MEFEFKPKGRNVKAFLNMLVLVGAWPIYFMYVGCFLQEGNSFGVSINKSLKEMEYY